MIKEMLEKDKPPTAEVVKHIDRCLSCLACMTTCPSGVHYMHLVDHARRYIASYELVTGKTFQPDTREPLARIAAALGAQ